MTGRKTFERRSGKRLGVLGLLAGLLLWSGVAAAAMPEGMVIEDNGVIKIGPAVFYLLHFNPDWQGSDQRKLQIQTDFPKRSADSFQVKGFFKAGGSDIEFQLDEKIVFANEQEFRYLADLTAAAPAPTAALWLAIDLPAGQDGLRITADGSEVSLPAASKELTLASQPAERILIGLPDREIEITGNFAFLVQDNRQFGLDSFSIRLAPPDFSSQISSWRQEVVVRLLKPLPNVSPLRVDPNRGILLGDALFNWNLFDRNWRQFARRQETYTPDGKASVTTPVRSLNAGVWRAGTPSREIDFHEELRLTGPSAYHYSAHLKMAEPVEANCLALVLILPTENRERVLVDKQPLFIPENYREMMLLDRPKVNSLVFETSGYIVTVSGNFGLVVQDNRRWTEEIHFRLLPAHSSGRITSASLELDLRFEVYDTAAIDLRGIANAPFPWEPAGRAEWQELPAAETTELLQPGQLALPGVAFSLIESAPGRKTSCLAVSGRQNQFPAAASVEISGRTNLKYLYLLHTAVSPSVSGQPVGRIVAEYPGGAIEEFPVLAGQDCGSYLAPGPLANAAVVWTGETADSYVGLQLSQFNLGRVPRRLTFKAADSSTVWLIAGASLGERALKLDKIESPVFQVAGPRWLPIEFNGNTVAGSPLDFSGGLDQPAGKYGPVTVNSAGHFAFRDAPEKRIRFFGPNLLFSAIYLTKEQADDFIVKASRLGYNTVRFHHFEEGLIDHNSEDPLAFDPVALDRLDYFFAELKRNGFYLTLDLYASRRLTAKDRIEEMRNQDYLEFEMKVLAPVSPSAMNNWKEFARRLLTRKNPYTGLTWAEDPALYSVNLINENGLVYLWNHYSSVIPLYEARYVEYLRKRKLDTPENRTRRDGLFIEFLNELQTRCIAEQTRFLKEELKLTALVTDLNLGNQYSLAGVRRQLDFVDNHIYWDHPAFPERMWRLPYRYSQVSALRRQAAIPREIMPSRIFGKPFTVTEFNYCNPNRYRLEAPTLIGGYAGLQDWDGLYRFAWSHNEAAMRIIGAPQGFDIVNDPQAQLAERIIHMLFLRGDVAAAKPAYGFRFDPKHSTSAEYPDEFSLLGLFGRIGTLAGAATPAGITPLKPAETDWLRKLPAGARQALEQLRNSGRLVSATGQIELNTRQPAMKVITPYSEVITLHGAQSGRVMELDRANVYQTVALLSLDRKKLTESSSLLLFQLTDQAGSKQKFSNASQKLLLSFGSLPILLERSKVEVALALPAGFKVEALKLDGSSNGSVPSVYRQGKLCFTADNGSKPGGVMVYHLTR